MASVKTSASESKKGSRADAVHGAFNKAIRNILRPVNTTSISEAFPYANPETIAALVEQTQKLFTHYCNDRWESLESERSILELCSLFDQLEWAAIDHLSAGLAPHRLTRDPQLAIPPLALQLIVPLLKHYQSMISDQRRRNEALHAHIIKQATEVERLEKGIVERMNDVKQSVNTLEDALK